MILKRWFQRPNSPARRLYEAIVAAARHPVPYAAWGVADTVDGRFDMISLHAYLTLDRLKGEADTVRQELVDEFFADMDRSLREMGVGDLSVGKKVRKMAEAFYGRVTAYEQGLRDGEAALADALSRNVFPDGAPQGGVAKLAAYVGDVRRHLAAIATADILSGSLTFPEPLP